MPKLKKAAGESGATAVARAFLLRSIATAFLILLAGLPVGAQSRSEARDRIEQPEKVMEVTGVKPGMAIGEVGAGSGYFTFWLARGVGEKGKIYANDISRSALDTLEHRAADERVMNIETVLGTVDDPRLPPASLDMVFMVNAFHDLEKPVELLANLLPSLKPGGIVVIMDRDPARFSDTARHFLTREEVTEMISRSVFELDRVEDFLRDHNLYLLKARND